MKEIGFTTKLCKPRHPYTKGKVERLMRYIKENFLPGRTFVTLLDLNKQAQVWCDEKNCKHRKGINDIPQNVHSTACAENLKALDINSSSIYAYLCPERKVSFDGFVAYDGTRYGIPFQCCDSVVRVHRVANTLQIFTQDLSEQIVVHTINENKDDVFCPNQFELAQPEETPSAPVKINIRQERPLDDSLDLSFEKFSFFEKGDESDER